MFLQLFYYFRYIIPLNIKLTKISIFQIHKVHHYSAMHYFSYVIKFSVSFVNKCVFQIVKVHHTTTINIKLKIMFCVAFKFKLWTDVTKLSTNIFYANKFFIQIHLVSPSLNINKYVFYVWCSDIVHSGPVHFSKGMLDWYK
jgi:hypothetical protein